MPVQKAGCEALEYNNGTDLIKTGTLVTINNEIENNAIRNVRFDSTTGINYPSVLDNNWKLHPKIFIKGTI